MGLRLLTLVLVPVISLLPFGFAADPQKAGAEVVSIAERAHASTWGVAHDAETASTFVADSTPYDRPHCWSDIYDLESTKVSSEIVPSLFETEIADDFWLPPGQEVEITGVRWWGGPYDSNGPDVTAFSLSLYHSAGLVPADSAFWETQGAQPTSVYIGNSIYESPTYEYELSVDIPISVGINPRYWLSIQAEHPWPVPQWGMQGSDDFESMFPYFRSEWFGNPEWEVLPLILEYKWEASFEIECRRVHGVHSDHVRGSASVLREIDHNPGFSPTTVALDLPEAGPVQLGVFDVSGRLVKVLVREERPAGWSRVVWAHDDETGRRVAPGVYFLQLTGRGLFETSKITVLE